MIAAVLLFLLGLVLLIKGGDWFVDGATGLAHRFHVPEILIGATVVSIGTTLPEVMVSATSAVSGHGEIAYGNAIGSIICNAALIAAIVAAVRPSEVDKTALRVPVAFFFGASAVYVIAAYVFGSFSRLTGVLLLLIFAAYMGITITQAVKGSKTVTITTAGEKEEPEEMSSPLYKDILLLVIGAALIAVGANLLVNNGTIIAQALGVPESVIALTIVALGTSLPELVTAVTALIKGHNALSLGNVIGANLFNLVLVSGVSTVLSPFAVPASKLIAGMNASLVVDIPLMLLVMAFLTLPALKRGKLSRFQGVTLLLVYAGFCVFQFVS